MPSRVRAPRWRWFVAVAGVAVLVAGGWLATNASSELTTLWVVNGSSGDVVHQREVEVGEEFELTHRHSVTRRIVYETFSVLDADTVAMEEMWFDEFGANLPAGPEDIDGETTEFHVEEGGFRVVHDSRPLGVVPFITGSAEVDHTIEFADGATLRLLDVVPPGTPVEVRVGHENPSAQ